MSHPTRQRITLALAEPATVSELSRRLRTNKGNVAHHIGVLEKAGIVRRAGRRTGRGGTQVLFQRVPASVELEDRVTAGAMAAAFTEGMIQDDDPFALLRHITLSPAQAKKLSTYLEKLVMDIDDNPRGAEYNILVAVTRS
jgi:DNA-binding transcriptional ArsR family regulator